MLPHETLIDLLKSNTPPLALAPMQDVSSLAFWRLQSGYSPADIYWTEFFRVHSDSHLEKWILEAINKNPTGKPIIAQMVGNDIPALVRSAKQLQHHPIAAVDLNLGCPAPVVYRKAAGGGLLKDLKAIDNILGHLRAAVTIPLTVKTRIGFDSPDHFDELLDLFEKHHLDLVAIHGRTVKQMYTGTVHYDLIAHAARRLPCPVLANGNIYSAAQAVDLLKTTTIRGLMIGRGAIRNPWIFDQIRSQLQGIPPRFPTGREALAYIHALWDAEIDSNVREISQVQRMKKFMNYFGEGLEMSEEFLYEIRRVTTRAAFFHLCERYLDHNRPMALEPSKPKAFKAGL